MNTQSKNAIDMLLADSFKELAAAKPIEKITIREITDRAGVIRPTFYNHFQDKYELLEWIARKELKEPVEPLINNGMLKEAIVYVLTAMLNEKEFYIKAVNLGGQNSFDDVLKKCVMEIILSQVKQERLRSMMPYEWMTPEYAADFYAQSVCYTIITWAKDGMKIPAAQLADTMLFSLSHSALDIFRKLKA